MTKTSMDRKKRPVVVVTGIGIVTSLGQGKEDNWASLTAGRSGIHAIERFPTDHLSTTVCGSIDFLRPDPGTAPGRAKVLGATAALEAVTQARIGGPYSFPGPLFLATPPAELEWPTRREIYDKARNGAAPTHARLKQTAREGDYQSRHELFLFGQVG
ncbi:MAG: hypothetical protein MI861_00330, partial [Pirellulales bacterium]|nr:hypothetical protein [Pirellulales bacterium]